MTSHADNDRLLPDNESLLDRTIAMENVLNQPRRAFTKTDLLPLPVVESRRLSLKLHPAFARLRDTPVDPVPLAFESGERSASGGNRTFRAKNAGLRARSHLQQGSADHVSAARVPSGKLLIDLGFFAKTAIFRTKSTIAPDV
ncbi:hypothetical protein [Burkholderia pyrrocinia]